MYLHLSVMISVRSLIGYMIIINQLKKNKENLAISDKPISSFNVATDNNLKYWSNKLQSKSNLLKECSIRGIDIEEARQFPNNNIASVLITYDLYDNSVHAIN